jgi:uncharacterized protein YdhG (YjbR/CyaY superfamily)
MGFTGKGGVAPPGGAAMAYEDGMSDNPIPLPPIGRPATRALESIGVTRLDQVQNHRAEDVLALHGVGPSAIGRLRTALADHGMFFAGEGPRRDLSDDVQQYIDAIPASHRPLFDRLQDLIPDEAPDAQILISYQIPLYKVGRRHVGLNPRRPNGITLTTTSPDHIAAFAQRHPQFKTNKASIQFGFDDELPDDDIRDVVRRATRSGA